MRKQSRKCCEKKMIPFMKLLVQVSFFCVCEKYVIALWISFQSGVQRANQRAISNVAKIKKFSILPKDFSIVSGELGSTFKLKRPVVLAKYAEIVEKMYAEDNAD
jgi:hypothetical protein